jgi:outer membrane lipoprotein-sorting protein
LKFVLLRKRQALAVGLIAVAPALTGCLTHIRTVPKTRPPDVVQSATLDQLLQQVNQRYDAVNTFNASVEVVASEGGSRQGQIKELTSVGGYIFLRKPEELRILLRVPVLGSLALDMVSNGKSWKLWVPSKKIARTGTNQMADPSQHGLESLRPNVIFDSLMIKGLEPKQIVSLTQDSRVYPDPKSKKDLVEEPDYEIAILAEPTDKMVHALRVIHIGRSTLLPYQEDIYGPDGTIVTRAYYSDYQNFGDIQYPTKIKIDRPQDQYGLAITITKLTLNQKLDDDQFELTFPEGVVVKPMD